MKQRYITPGIITIMVRNPLLQTASQKNVYNSEDESGLIRVKDNVEVDAGDSD